ncbi:MAG: indolepyruvate ferredoxin oxidoreductase family protein [Deltaproteobacteria bacterium]|nr:MAG: indolepyruvate ferredoxin oxidoreductase family protein [Deltaproteobacteria bacterium]
MTLESARFDENYALSDRYTLESGRVYLNGIQALVRLPMLQRQRDLAAGLNTAGFISGYRGSPLGTYDMALWQAKSLLEQHQIRFEPGINEDLAATAVWGSQQVNLLEGGRYDGVFGIWYGKGPGVDRSCDALKHGNYAGTSPHGGVLVLTGDDPSARSSSIAHQSEHALIHCGIPILNPSTIQEYLDLGLYGWALSRFSGCWIGFKCLTDTVDSSRSVALGPERVRVVIPDDFEPPEGGLNIGWANLPLAVERRLFQHRLKAVEAFVRANGLDRVVLDSPKRRLGIVTTGKAYLDVRQALDELGLDESAAADLGLSLYKVAMTWPLEPEGARRFAAGLEDLLVIEEKRPIIEEQLARLLYNLEDRPRLAGKIDEQGNFLVPAEGELTPSEVAEALRTWLERRAPELAGRLRSRVYSQAPASPATSLMRLPAFCSGCPHNSSTVVPEGSIAMGGIGCHGMAVWLPERRTLAVTQMGGEGANWIGQAPFTDTPHIFQNMGDGTYFHSGLLAIRAAVTAKVNITYKVLANGSVAMTGGQPIEGVSMEGEVTVPEIARQLDAEGVGRIAVVSNEPDKYPRAAGFPKGVTFHHRDELDRVQVELRSLPGVTAIVYDQICAAEARRLRKRGEFPDPDRRIVINELVCEGCGDCNVQSNCISVEPVETEFGRKRRINQSSCNKDYSCLKGYCPSFVSVLGGRVRKTGGEAIDTGDDALFARLPPPQPAATPKPYDVLVTGIGGSGVVTIGALLGMAAHLEGKGCSVLDVTGLAQKNGPVTSHVRIADDPDALHATRIGAGSADLVLGCDIVVATSAENLSKMTAGRTTAVINCHVSPTSEFASHPDLDLSSESMENTIRTLVGEEDAHLIEGTELATALMGDSIATNLFLVGYALQKGRLPVGLGALERAIELNGREVEMNKRALAWGRLAAHDMAAVREAAQPALRSLDSSERSTTLDETIARRVDFLTAYQNAAYARRYTGLVERVAARERELGDSPTRLTEAVARYYFKLLAYKDEYEVARLYTDGEFMRTINEQFEGDFKLQIHLAPQILNRRDPDTGRARKYTLGAWMFVVLKLMAKLKFLRGTWLDVPGWAAHRRRERQLIREYEDTLAELLEGLKPDNYDLAVEIASVPEHIRGFDLVKEQHLRDAKAKEVELLAAFRLRTASLNR